MSRARHLRLIAAAAVAATVVVPSATMAGPTPADLRLSVTAPSEVAVGSVLTYELEVSNDGPSDALGVLLEVPLSEGLEVQSVEPSAGTCVEGAATVTCELGPLAAAGALTVDLDVGAARSGRLATDPIVSSPTGADPEAANDSVEHVVRAAGDDCTVIGDENDNDDLRGTPNDDVICGFEGDDVMTGLGGNDQLLGGPGNDTADFSSSARRVRVDLAAGTAKGEGRDTLDAVENATGTPGDDLLRGSGVPNVLDGGAGNDVLWGLDAVDALTGGGGADFLHGGRGADTLTGGPGPDVCVVGPGGEARAECEGPTMRDPNDTRGPMDLRTVRGPAGAMKRAVWRFRTHRWTIRRIRDEGFLLVWLDLRGSADWDHLLLARSDGRRLLGRVFRLRARRETKIATVRARHPNRRVTVANMAFHKVPIGPHRTYFRWSAQSIFNGPRCARSCFDRVPRPSAGGLIHPAP